MMRGIQKSRTPTQHMHPPRSLQHRPVRQSQTSINLRQLSERGLSCQHLPDSVSHLYRRARISPFEMSLRWSPALYQLFILLQIVQSLLSNSI